MATHKQTNDNVADLADKRAELIGKLFNGSDVQVCFDPYAVVFTPHEGLRVIRFFRDGSAKILFEDLLEK